MVWAVTDINALLELSGKEVVTACELEQAADSSIALVIVITSESSSSGRLVVFKPFKPGDVLSINKDTIRSLLIPPSTPYASLVRTLRLGHRGGKTAYPQIFIAYKKLNEVSTAEETARIVVKDDLSSWSINEDVNLPVNADRILDICPGLLFEDDGIFVLHRIGKNLRLTFVSYSGESSTSVSCSNSSTKLAVFPDEDGESNLLIIGEGLQSVSQTAMGRNKAKGSELLAIKPLPLISDISIVTASPTEPNSRIAWVALAADRLACLTLPHTQDESDSTPETTRPVTVTGILNASSLSSFSTESDAPSLLVATQTGQVMLLESSPDRKIYSASPLALPFVLGPAMPTYTCTLTVIGSDQITVRNAIVRLRASKCTAALVNGQPCSLTESGSYFSTSPEGQIQLAVPKAKIEFLVDRILGKDGSNLGDSDFSKLIQVV